ncbi:hypothetical protein LIER_07257 [Lithospermum erythrorhizon]|uniref:Uncharacterized protein n=1 Tax=Lithospermum erythrorhizon TaxID=34254 RepID=A0AAV3P9E1_LITER
MLCSFGRNNGIAVDVRRRVPGLFTPGYVYLACNAFGFFQLTALCFPSWGESHFEDSISILRAHHQITNQNHIDSFPVWNFE